MYITQWHIICNTTTYRFMTLLINKHIHTIFSVNIEGASLISCEMVFNDMFPIVYTQIKHNHH